VAVGPLWVIAVADPTLPATGVAFALGRPLGPAVRRNRLRRRLREALRAADAAGRLPRGLYLVGARPGATDLSSDALRTLLGQALSRLPGVIM
jgi:ribonuclease P protein component